MFTAPLAPHLSTLAPDFARRFALITAGLAALVARAFLRNPRLIPLIIPLCKRLACATRRCTALMALLAAGRSPRPHRPGRSGTHTAKPKIPGTHAWLIRTLRHEAAGYASQLAHLLAEPAAAELLEAVPAAARALRPIRRLLGIDEPAARQSAGGRNGEAYSAETALPRAAQPVPALPPVPPPIPSPRLPPVLGPPPCPHVGFPWFSLPGPKRA